MYRDRKGELRSALRVQTADKTGGEGHDVQVAVTEACAISVLSLSLSHLFKEDFFGAFFCMFQFHRKNI